MTTEAETASDPLEIEAFAALVAQLRAAFFALRGLTARMLDDLDCTAPERSLLVDLDEDGAQTVPALARTRAISRQAMQKAVDRQVARGWLAIEPNPAHQRSSLVALAPGGARVLAEIRRREVAALSRAELPVGAAELRRAAAALGKIATYFSTFEPEVAASTRRHGGQRR